MIIAVVCPPQQRRRLADRMVPREASKYRFDPHRPGSLPMLPRHLALMIVVNLVWGLNLIAGKIGVEHIPPVMLAALRFALLMIVLGTVPALADGPECCWPWSV